MKKASTDSGEELPRSLAADIQLYLDGKITKEAFEKLQTLLSSDGDARKFYRSYANMDGNLREISEEEVDKELATTSAPSGGGRGIAIWPAAATFILGAGVVYLMSDRPDPPTTVSSVEERPAMVIEQGQEQGLATLTQAVGVEWTGADTNFVVGSILPNDTLEIEKGLLQLEFHSGAIVILEGPAKLELIDSMRAICHFGKTRVNVPESARGFTIASQSMDIVDLGTEFALVVAADGQGEAHVFDGSIEVHEKPSGQMHHVMAGNGVRLNEGALEFLPLNEMGFVDAEHVSVMAGADAERHLEVWREYSEELKAHPDVLLYYSFDSQPSWSRQLRNVRKMTVDPLHGAIVGCRWSQGRWTGKSSLEFKGTGDRVRIQIPGEHDSFSLMAWVRIDGFDRDLNSLMLSDNWVPGGLHWQFTREGELILGTRHQNTGVGHYQSAAVLNQSHLGRWIQLAACYDSEKRRIAHYVNGENVWESSISDPVKISVPRGELGNWKTDYEQTNNNIRNLNGRMDEFVVFSRGLTDAEMKDLYGKGRPHG